MHLLALLIVCILFYYKFQSSSKWPYIIVNVYLDIIVTLFFGYLMYTMRYYHYYEYNRIKVQMTLYYLMMLFSTVLFVLLNFWQCYLFGMNDYFIAIN